MTFAWIGGVARGRPHYYRVQGPTFLVEYDNTQTGANHVRAVWRAFDGDFGADLPGEHYRHAAHHRRSELAEETEDPLDSPHD